MPEKAIYQEFQSNGDLEFEHQLAMDLKMIVGEMRARMGSDEYERWKVWYGRRAQERDLASKQGG